MIWALAQRVVKVKRRQNSQFKVVSLINCHNTYCFNSLKKILHSMQKKKKKKKKKKMQKYPFNYFESSNDIIQSKLLFKINKKKIVRNKIFLKTKNDLSRRKKNGLDPCSSVRGSARSRVRLAPVISAIVVVFLLLFFITSCSCICLFNPMSVFYYRNLPFSTKGHNLSNHYKLY